MLTDAKRGELVYIKSSINEIKRKRDDTAKLIKSMDERLKQLKKQMMELREDMFGGQLEPHEMIKVDLINLTKAKITVDKTTDHFVYINGKRYKRETDWNIYVASEYEAHELIYYRKKQREDTNV